MEQFNKGSQKMQVYVVEFIFFGKIENRSSPTITRTPAMKPRSLEYSTKTWVVLIRLWGLLTKLTTSKFLRDICPDNAEVFLLLSITGLFTDRNGFAVDSGTVTYSTCPSSQHSNFGNHYQHLGHQTNAHLCVGKPSAKKQPFPDMIADEIHLAGCTHPQTQTMG